MMYPSRVFDSVVRCGQVRYEYMYRYSIYRSLYRGTDASASVYGFGSRGFCFVFTTATRCAWENNNFDINTRSNNAFKEKDPSLVYLFIFSFIIIHPSVR